jgi:ferrochelatase
MQRDRKKALLLINLGSPQAPEAKDVQRYLNEFLMDKYVLDFPYIFRLPLVKMLITPKRSPESAAAYRRIWRADGSPLIKLAEIMSDTLQSKVDFPVYLAMRYGSPSIDAVMKKIRAENPSVEELKVFPLYPQYTMSSYLTAAVAAKKAAKRYGLDRRLKFISPFYHRPEYIAALANSIRPYLEKPYDKLLFSYHGLPERHMRKDDEKIAREKDTMKDYALPEINYQKQCMATTAMVSSFLNLPKEKVATSFQSRLTQAGNEWIKPYTAVRLEELPQEGVKRLLVVCPAFINDCLETLDEIVIEGKRAFETAGGENLTYIPCLNDNAEWVSIMGRWANE